MSMPRFFVGPETQQAAAALCSCCLGPSTAAHAAVAVEQCLMGLLESEPSLSLSSGASEGGDAWLCPSGGECVLGVEAPCQAAGSEPLRSRCSTGVTGPAPWELLGPTLVGMSSR